MLDFVFVLECNPSFLIATVRFYKALERHFLQGKKNVLVEKKNQVRINGKYFETS